MKADLARREPALVQWWAEQDIYGKLRTQARGRPLFVLHDGPPYANGAMHIGHAANHVLKDFIIKARSLDGFDSPYVPGWDCHGLPIELQVEKKHGRVGQKMDARAFRAACRQYATEQVDLQRKDLIRLGVQGDWQRPYLTMDPKFEAQQIRALGKVIANGHLHIGAKPVYWCLDCRSALAEAEVEYEDKQSSAIDVAFAVAEPADLARRLAADASQLADAAVVIWTTTPWTLPANEAVALNEELVYAVVAFTRGDQQQVAICAEALIEPCAKRWQAQELKVLARVPGKALEGLKLRHPFLSKQVPIILGAHVTVEAGTGAVHTAPAHGHDDYIVGQRYGLPVVNPVLGDGRFESGVPVVGGMKLEEASAHLIKTMEASGALWCLASLQHSYPHCWRHKTPVIFRATPQWFISMDQNGLRAGALRDIPQVQWIPEWGQQRIAGMIEKRPDWCISRQRTWGVPIALFVHRQSRQLHPETQQLLIRIADAVEREGLEAWFESDASRWLSPADADQYDKVTDVMDVWSDSGVSFECVAAQRPELKDPKNPGGPFAMYLEGSDQHRGWFHSSLLMSEAMYGRAPYERVLTHGFVVDDKGRKMSKSLGNVVAPDKVMNNLGADVLRLWVAATDYTGEMSCSDEILKRSSEAYRRIRNTFRYLLGSLHGFDPAADALPIEQCLSLDIWALQRAHDIQAEIIQAYRDYQFHLVYQKVHNFCVNDLGGLYLDVLKDRLYTLPAQSQPRRSAQTALFHIAQAMVRWLTPVLSFTAEEIWQLLPKRPDDPQSVLLCTWYELPSVKASAIDWNALLALRTAVQKSLETLRDAGSIGAPLEADVEVLCLPEQALRYRSVGAELKFLFITASAVVTEVSKAPAGAEVAMSGESALPGTWLKVTATTAAKCDRCWHRVPDVGSTAEHPSLCKRCVGNISGLPEVRRHV